MSRPKSNKKGVTLPMSANGGSDPRVPADVVWNDENPPVIHMCSNDVEHAPGCNTNCESVTLTEIQCKLVNEARAWARLGLVFLGIPKSMTHFPVSGIDVEILDTELRGVAMRDMLIEAGIFTEEEIDEKFRKIKYDKLHELRTANERAIKEAKTKEMLGIGKTPILGPNGEPIG